MPSIARLSNEEFRAARAAKKTAEVEAEAEVPAPAPDAEVDTIVKAAPPKRTRATKKG